MLILLNYSCILKQELSVTKHLNYPITTSIYKDVIVQ